MFPFSNPTGITMRDVQGFAPPPYGGTLAVKQAALVYTDTASKLLLTLPKGAIIDSMRIVITTAFNDSGTDVANIGTAASATAYWNGVDLSTAGVLVDTNAAFAYATLNTPLTDDTPIYGIYVGQNSNASAGAAILVVRYYLL